MARKKEIDNGYRPPFSLSAKAVGMACSCVQNHTCTQYSFCVSLSGCLSAHVSDNPQGAAIGVYLSRHSVPSLTASSSNNKSLKGSNRYTLRHGRRIITSDHPSPSLKGSDRDCPMAQPLNLHTTKTL